MISPTKITELISCIFIVLFVYTAFNKLQHPEAMQTVLKKSTALAPVAAFLSIAIPITELIVSVLLALPKWRPAGLSASLSLMILFTVYIGYMMLTVPHLPCSCGGALKQLSWTQHLFFNSFFIVLAIYGLHVNRQPNKAILLTSFLRKNRKSRKPV